MRHIFLSLALVLSAVLIPPLSADAREAKPPYIGVFTLRDDDKTTLVDGLDSPAPYRVCVSEIRDNACKITLDRGHDLKINSGNCVDVLASRLTIKKRGDTCIGTYGRAD